MARNSGRHALSESSQATYRPRAVAAPAFRAAVYQAFSVGILPLEGNNTGRIVTLCLTGDAAQPFLFMECN